MVNVLAVVVAALHDNAHLIASTNGDLPTELTITATLRHDIFGGPDLDYSVSLPPATVEYLDDEATGSLTTVGTHTFYSNDHVDGFCVPHQSYDCSLSALERRAYCRHLDIPVGLAS